MADHPTRRTRLFALTPATGAAPSPLVMHSFVTAAVPADQVGGLPQEWRTAVSLCRHPRAVAEVAARLGLPLTTVIGVLTELAARGLVHHQPPMTENQATDVTLLRRIRSGLQAL
jgi:hypothetical protein